MSRPNGGLTLKEKPFTVNGELEKTGGPGRPNKRDTLEKKRRILKGG